MLDSIPDPLLLVDADLEIARANPAARALFGDDAVGRGLAAVLRDPAVLEATEECLAGGAPEAVGFELPGPVERFFSVRAAPLVAGLDAPRRALLALHDETGIRRAQRMRADFVANVSHELRTPLATLLGFIETLRGPARDDAEARERFLGIMNEQTVRMSRLVRDLLSLSKIEESELTPPTGRVDLAAVLGSVVDGLSLQAKAREVRVVLDLPAGLPPAQGDADQLSQVFQNLLDNAIAYGRARDEVRVAVAVVAAPPGMPAPGRALAVAVADRGEGIPREHLSRLTERFYRIDTGRSRRMGGTGLGLAIAKHIVNRHRGALRIESEVGKGSVFTVYLPVSADAWTPSVATARR